MLECRFAGAQIILNPATIGKALKVSDYLKNHNITPTKIFEEIQPQPDGSAIYIFEAQFATLKQAEMFKALAEISKAFQDAIK